MNMFLLDKPSSNFQLALSNYWTALKVIHKSEEDIILASVVLLELHEALEWARIDGKPIINPHDRPTVQAVVDRLNIGSRQI